MIRRSLLLVACLAAAPAQAQWANEVSLGYLAASGNTETESLNGKATLVYKTDQWTNTFTGLGAYSTEQDDTTAERYAASDKFDWNLSEVDYLFAAVDWDKDLFGGIRERTSETVGYGRHVLTGPEHLLDLEIGAGARQSELNGTRDNEDDIIARGSAKYQWTISETSQFVQALKVETGDFNTYVESVSELKLAIVGDLFAALSYTVKHNSEVPDTSEKTDTYTAVSLAYNFGSE
ncbi:MAG: DUF481 domain-containing protein [Pseudomonadota bacterium]|nr:DUF481 domain-containing protein [Pseudomonadota bacterium]